MEAYRPRRDGRFEYVTEAIAHVEDRFCSKNCAVPTPGSQDDYPGGDCPLLIGILLEEVQDEIQDDGVNLNCMDYRPLPDKRAVEPQTAIYEGYYPDGED